MMRRDGWIRFCLVAGIAIAGCGGDGPAAGTARPAAELPAVEPLAEAACSPMAYGGAGSPRVLVGVSSLLQGQFAATHGIPAAKAVKLVMRERGWKAGPYTVALQLCNEADAKAGESDPRTCLRNARAFASNRSVVGAVGPYFSTCAAAMIATLNEAPDGPLALVSGAPSYLGLTRSGPGTAPEDPERHYPTGRRNFVRVVPTDDVQGAAAAVYAQERGARRLFALHNRDPYGKGVTTAFATAAERLGLALAGSASWDGEAPHFRSLARRVAAAGTDAVYLGGYHSDNGGRLIRDLRDALGERPLIMASDGFADAAPIVEGAGSRGEGVAITTSVLPPRALPAAGRAFVERYEKRFGHRPCCYAVHYADALGLLLDAIARSDGTRASVVEELFRTPRTSGLTGEFEVDEHGDTRLAAMGVYRIRDGQLRFDERLTPPIDLLERSD